MGEIANEEHIDLDHIFNLIVLLKSFQRLGDFPKLSDIPNPLVNHIRGYLKLPPEIVLGYENSKTMYRHRSAIREYLKVKAFDKMARHLAVGAVYESALVMDNPADLINVVIGELVKQRYELPGFSTLDRLVRRVRYLANQKIFNWVINRLDEEYIQRLNDLLELPEPVDLSFASPQWQKLVLVRQGEKIKLVRRHWEVCVSTGVESPFPNIYPLPE